MKKILFSFLQSIGYVCSYLFPLGLIHFLSSIRDKIVTGYLRRHFHHLGHSVIMWHPYTLRGLHKISIGDGNIIEPDLQLTVLDNNQKDIQITIGNDCLIRRGAHITATNSIVIGNGLLTGTNVLITDNAHGTTDFTSLIISPCERPAFSKGPVIIGDNVWMGNNVCVMPGVTIGNGVIVGANSIVTHDLPDYCIAGGIPAKVIKRAKEI